jgi:hypothetical protein
VRGTLPKNVATLAQGSRVLCGIRLEAGDSRLQNESPTTMGVAKGLSSMRYLRPARGKKFITGCDHVAGRFQIVDCRPSLHCSAVRAAGARRWLAGAGVDTAGNVSSIFQIALPVAGSRLTAGVAPAICSRTT